MTVDGTISEEAPQSVHGNGLESRPNLAPEVRLIGTLQGSGFAERQWLVQRGETYIQLSEILYRTLERCDGGRTVAEVAEDLSRSTSWDIPADVALRLVESKLAPLGLVQGQDSDAGHRPAPATGSVFAVQLKRKVLDAASIENFARPLSVLFSPFVMVPVVVASLVAHCRLYFAHPVTQPIADVIRNPELFLVVFALALVAAVFHEFGHAAALRYGGGRARAMGFGFYLLFPAFYTDVTEGYRLSRASRIRTDLGGVYFHLVASLLIFVASLTSGASYLLVVVMLLDVEIVRQLFPLVRMDGYWLLADVTGAPDPLSLAVPVLRRLLRLPAETAGPRLRPRVQAVYVGYLALSLVVLPLLVCITISRIPALTQLIWRTMRVEIGRGASAIAAGNAIAIIASVLHVFLLAVQLAGLFAFLFFVAVRPALRGWRWTRAQAPSIRRIFRSAMLLGAAGGLLIVAALLPWRSSSGVLGIGMAGTSTPVGLLCLITGCILAILAPAAIFLAGRYGRPMAAVVFAITVTVVISTGIFRTNTAHVVDNAIQESVRSITGREATTEDIRRFGALADEFGLSVVPGSGPYVAFGAAAFALAAATYLVGAAGSRKQADDAAGQRSM